WPWLPSCRHVAWKCRRSRRQHPYRPVRSIRIRNICFAGSRPRTVASASVRAVRRARGGWRGRRWHCRSLSRQWGLPEHRPRHCGWSTQAMSKKTTPAIVNRAGPDDLATLAAQITLAHEQCTQALKAGLDHALRAGKLLLEAKARVGHGDWLDWLSA